MNIEIKEYIIDKFKEYLKREDLDTDEETIEDELNKFVELNLDLII
jgi:hypothetical protein